MAGSQLGMMDMLLDQHLRWYFGYLGLWLCERRDFGTSILIEDMHKVDSSKGKGIRS